VKRKIKVGDVVVILEPAPGTSKKVTNTVGTTGTVVQFSPGSIIGDLYRVKTNYCIALWYYPSCLRLAKPTDILRAKLTGTTVDDTNI
jgi:hypothetical protein